MRKVGSISNPPATFQPLDVRTILGTRSEKGDEFPEARAGLGLLLLRFGREEEARGEFDTALQEKGDLWEAHYGKARLLLDQEKWEEAVSLSEQSAAITPVVHPALCRLWDRIDRETPDSAKKHEAIQKAVGSLTCELET